MQKPTLPSIEANTLEEERIICHVQTYFQGNKLQRKNDANKTPKEQRKSRTTAVRFNNDLDLMHVDLKTAFLQGESFDHTRDVVCQLPPEAGYPANFAARMLKPGYGLNDAPRRWWNEIDKLSLIHI